MSTNDLRSLTGSADADALIPLASELIWAVRCLDAAAVDDTLNRVLAESGPGWRTLAILLAAMVPDDEPPSRLLGWIDDPANYQRLRERGYSRSDVLEAMRLPSAGR